jgi:uncharacterized protein YuzE
MATRTISGTLDTFQVNTGSEITYLGNTAASDTGGINLRGFRVNPASTGDIIVKIDRSSGIQKIEIFQEDAYTGSSAASGYKTIDNIAKNGKSKGAVGITVTNATKNYVVLLTLDSYSEVKYGGSVVVP